MHLDGRPSDTTGFVSVWYLFTKIKGIGKIAREEAPIAVALHSMDENPAAGWLAASCHLSLVFKVYIQKVLN